MHRLSFLIVLLLISVTLAGQARADEQADERPKVLVYELRNDGADASVARIVGDSLTSELSSDRRLHVVSVDDVRDFIELQGTKEEAGCDVDSSACQAEIAQAMGARYVVFGTVGKLGELSVVNLSLTDTANSEVLAREKLEVRRVEDIAPALKRVAARMAAVLVGPAQDNGYVVPTIVLSSGAVLGVASFIYGFVENGNVNGDGEPRERRDAETRRNIAYGVATAGAVVGIIGAAWTGFEVIE